MVSTEVQRRQFERDGYVVHRDVLEPATCDALVAALSEQIERLARLHERGEREDDFWRQLPRSAASIEVFWRPAPEGSKGYPESRVMRVGHALHVVDARFADLALRSPVAAALATALGPGARVVQSAVIYKQPHDDIVQFGFHQDAAYLTTEPSAGALALAFVALDDADAENGALMVASASHTHGLGERLRLGPAGFERAAGAPRHIRREDSVLLTMRRGDVAVVDGLTYHASDPNRSSRPRRGLIIHAIAKEARLAPTAWVKEPPEGFVAIELPVRDHDQ